MTPRRILRVVSVLGSAVALVAATSGAAGAANAGGQSSLAAARAATAAYHDADAIPSSYAQFLPCMQSSDGGMGQHFVDFTLVANPAEDAAHPEALVYAETPHGYRLVALEYIVPAGLVDPANPPTLFGQSFHEAFVPGAGDLYVLHAWIWKHNPDGMFEDFNANLDACSGT